ncbi:MAG TPA: hypothetical protein VN802_13595 [Stellaceae bacterium]|nr:hypothetical protein [Stellaceae bacterium]
MTNLPEDWDAWMRDVGAESSFTQTSHWARIHEAINGAAPHCLELRDGDRRVAAALLGYRRQPIASIRDVARAALRGRGGVLECFGGPVIASAHPARALARILDDASALAARLGAAGLVFTSPPPNATWLRDPDIEGTYAAQGYVCAPWMTALVDIARPDAALLASFRQSARKGIRRCGEFGLAVRECRDAADYVENFSRPLFATRRAFGLEAPAGRAERHWWHLDEARHYRYFMAFDRDGQVLGTLGTYRWNGVATEIMSERTLPAREAHVPVQDLLHWHAFQVHRALGDRLFDLAGFNPNPGNEKEQGIRAFKEKWMGRPVAIPRFERMRDKLQYRLARTLYRRLAPSPNGHQHAG